MKLLHRLLWSSRQRCRLLHRDTRIPDDTGKTSDPLRILFCGSDDFSIASLRALHNEDWIQSIDVVCRPDKRTGRGLKNIRQVPIKRVAQELRLPIHEIDSTATWSSPSYINLIVAVSFGLLIPARVIRKAKYGGLNLHPSLLPDLRGSSPIHYTLLLNRKYTGVTLQTLHPTKFDHGQILAQTPFPGISVPEDATPSSLVQLLAPIGAELLVQGLRNHLYAPPVTALSPLSPSQIDELTDGKGIAQAPKMTPGHKMINWKTITAADLQTCLRVHGSCWDNVTYKRITASSESKRIIFTKLGRPSWSTGPKIESGTSPGCVNVEYDSEGNCWPIVMTSDGIFFTVEECTVEGGAKGEGRKDLKKAIEAEKRKA